ncbi:MAG TPA: RDD family protein [Candidatus Acidoferrum sp.]|nr:RDD family protein [Candidatus Acidoferrum sp.]
MHHSIDFRTGEAVAIEYELAGLGSRFLAVVVDGAAQLAVLAVVFGIAIGVAPAVLRVVPSKYLGSVALAALAVVLFVVLFGWFVVFETWWAGRTPGKRLVGIRVVREGGFPLDWGAAVIRNLVRLVEMLLGFYALSAISTLLSSENKRLGDLAAGTIVIRDRAIAPPDLDALLADAPRPRSDTGLRDDDRVLVERFLARREGLDPDARHRLATRLAQRIRPTLRASYGALDDEALLEFLSGR